MIVSFCHHKSGLYLAKLGGRLVGDRIPSVFFGCSRNVSVSCEGKARGWDQLRKQPLTCFPTNASNHQVQLQLYPLYIPHLLLYHLLLIIRYGFLTKSEPGVKSWFDGSSSPSLGAQQFCPSDIVVLPHRFSENSSATFPSGRLLCHHVCLDNKYQRINTIKWPKPHSRQNIWDKLPSSTNAILFFFVT